MLRDFFIPLAEMLFWFTGGELLINSLWMFVWVIGGAFVMVIPLWYAIRTGKPAGWVPMAVFVVSFFPMLLVITSPGIIQTQLMEECLPVQTVSVNTDLVKNIDISVRHCRYKTNFYDENFGPWQARAVDSRSRN
jgi:hypothetical protein